MPADLPVNEFVRDSPEPALRRFIASYGGYRQRGVQPRRHRGLPSPFLAVIFTLDEPLHIVQHVDPRQSPGSYRTLAGGLHTSPALIGHDGAQSGIQLRLSPLGAHALLGMPAGELTRIDLDASAVFGSVANEIHERLGQAASWPERFAVLDRVLRRCTRNVQDPPDEIGFAWRCLLRSGGTLPISDLVREVGWSDRHLAHRFRTEIGLTPKTAARVIRFHRAPRILQAHAPVTALADIAAWCRYYDQSHLAREFTQFAGCPSTWLVDEVENIQAMATADGERLAS